MKRNIDERSMTVLDFLAKLTANNDRTWFAENKSLYDEAREAFELITRDMIVRISEFDPEVSHLTVRDCTYRIYRDVRFSNDKRPYKIHMGAYISGNGKKSQHGGYYIHMQPGNCHLGGGAYCLVPQVLKAVRQSIVDNTEEFLEVVENSGFASLFKTIGCDSLKTAPQGFPKDFPYMKYIRPKDYSVMTDVPDDFFLSPDWMERTVEVFKTMKPFLDFINYTIDDYE